MIITKEFIESYFLLGKEGFRDEDTGRCYMSGAHKLYQDLFINADVMMDFEWENMEAVLYALSDGWLGSMLFDTIPKQHFSDREFVYKCIVNHSVSHRVLMKAHRKFKDNEDFVLKCVLDSKEPLMRYASKRLRDDKEFMSNLIKIKPNEYKNLSLRLKKDDEIKRIYNLWVAENGAMSLKNKPSVCDDKEIVMLAFKNGCGRYPNNLQYASARLRADKDVVLAAVAHNSDNFKHASEELKDDTDVVRLAVNSISYTRFMRDDCCPLQYASKRIRDNKEFALEFLDNKVFRDEGLKYFSDRIRGDEEVAAHALLRSRSNRKHIPDQVLKTIESK